MVGIAIGPTVGVIVGAADVAVGGGVGVVVAAGGAVGMAVAMAGCWLTGGVLFWRQPVIKKSKPPIKQTVIFGKIEFIVKVAYLSFEG
jgi:hypothetical protein